MGYYSGIQAYAGGNYTTTSHPTDLRFYTTDVNDAGGVMAEAMRIATNGNVAINTSTTTYVLTVNGQPGANGYTAFTNYSDVRLKKNISAVENSLEKIMKLRPVQFNYNEEYLNLYSDTASLSRVHKGFIAQEVKEIFPEMVSTQKVKGKEYFDLNLSNLQVYMVKAMQEQQKIIDTQQKKIEKLEKTVADLVKIVQADKRSLLYLTPAKQEQTKR